MQNAIGVEKAEARLCGFDRPISVAVEVAGRTLKHSEALLDAAMACREVFERPVERRSRIAALGAEQLLGSEHLFRLYA